MFFKGHLANELSIPFITNSRLFLFWLQISGDPTTTEAHGRNGNPTIPVVSCSHRCFSPTEISATDNSQVQMKTNEHTCFLKGILQMSCQSLLLLTQDFFFSGYRFRGIHLQPKLLGEMEI